MCLEAFVEILGLHHREKSLISAKCLTISLSFPISGLSFPSKSKRGVEGTQKFCRKKNSNRISRYIFLCSIEWRLSIPCVHRVHVE